MLITVILALLTLLVATDADPHEANPPMEDDDIIPDLGVGDLPQP